MKLVKQSDTSTPTDSTKALLCNGAIRVAQKPLHRFGAAMVLGTAAVGGAYGCSRSPTNIEYATGFEDSRDFARAGLDDSCQFQDKQWTVDLNTDGVVPVELQSYLHANSPVKGDFAPVDFDDSDYCKNSRLVPPPMKTREVRVRFHFIGQEAPRIHIDAEVE